MSSVYFDSHAHLAMLEHAPLADILNNAKAAQVETMVTVSTNEASWPLNQALAEKYAQLYYTLGLHPHDAEHWSHCKNKLREFYLNSPIKKKCVAIGETGLDNYYDFCPQALQTECFEGQIKLAHEFNLPLVIHCREAFESLFNSLNKIGIPKRAGIMHCFTGTKQEALTAVEMGFSISFSGILTFKNSEDLRLTAKEVPMERLLLETDCPFLAPVPFRGKKNEPSFLPHTANVLAKVRGLSVDEIAKVTTDNAKRLFEI